MEATTACRRDDFMCFAEDLLARWERRQAAAIPEEAECLPCLIEDQE